MMLGIRRHGPASAVVRMCTAFPPSLQARTREVFRVATPEAERGQGHGSELMRSLCAEADLGRLALVLQPESDRLAAWYERHGFETVQTAPAHMMARRPQTP